MTLLFLISSPASWAEDAFNRPGAYVGLGMAGGLSDFDGAARGFGDSPGFSFRGGYRFNDYSATEAVYEYMNDFGKERKGVLGDPAGEHLTTNNFSFMGKLLFPTLGITNLQPYASGGLGFLNVDGMDRVHGLDGAIHHTGSETEFAGRVDGGVDYFFTPQIATFLDVGYVMPTEQLDHLHYLSMGLGIKNNF
ncbi:MAG: outer membrane beta-barrel protein [Candidatus Binatia bacterium]